QPGGVSKKTGEEFEARDKVQILGKLPIPGGGTKLELIDLVTDDIQAFKSLHGKQIRVPVGVYAVRGSVGYFIPKGSQACAGQGSSAQCVSVAGCSPRPDGCSFRAPPSGVNTLLCLIHRNKASA
ncbi:hypothetical protein, partial [Pseudomonas aeruginosa]|uniref:hypothetical protein n=1 Tax=Pseudomonas aeruginosa TaxID=287 RepID=UPI000B23F5B5